MKLNTSRLRIALVCVSLLLSLSSTTAHAPETQDLKGTYTLNNPAATTKTVEDLIEAIVRDMWWPKQGKVRDKLREKNLPLSLQISISYPQKDVTITSASGTVQTALDGTPVDRTIQGEKLKVSTLWKGGKLERTFISKDGERVNIYSLIGDGKTLTMQATITSDKLPRPLTYELVYTRVAAKKHDT